MKNRKENAWKERRQKESARQAKIWAEGTLDQIFDQAWEELKTNSEERKKERLDIAGWKSLTAKVKNWKVTENHIKSDQKRRKDWQHTDSPSKKSRGGKGGGGTTAPTSPLHQCTLPTIETKTDTGGPRKPQDKKKLQVRSKKWVQRKNGLFGWVSCVQAEKGGMQASKVTPRIFHSGGVANSKNISNNEDGGTGGSAFKGLKNMAGVKK